MVRAERPYETYLLQDLQTAVIVRNAKKVIQGSDRASGIGMSRVYSEKSNANYLYIWATIPRCHEVFYVGLGQQPTANIERLLRTHYRKL